MVILPSWKNMSKEIDTEMNNTILKGGEMTWPFYAPIATPGQSCLMMVTGSAAAGSQLFHRKSIRGGKGSRMRFRAIFRVLVGIKHIWSRGDWREDESLKEQI